MIVPSLVNRAYVLDLMQGRSLIAALAAEMRITTNRDEGTAVWMSFDLR